MTLKIAPGVPGPKPINGDTLLVYLIDRSGSMASCWTDTIGGLNADLANQKREDDGKTEVAVYFFDQYGGAETPLVKAYEGPLAEAPEFDPDSPDYCPRGGTPLYDSVGRMIAEIEKRADASGNNPAILVSIFTDGQNNGFTGYTPEQAKQMVETCQGKGWTFTYFGANQDAWAVGGTFGISVGNTVAYSTNNMAQTMAVASMARSSYVQQAKAAKSIDPNAVVATRSFFADAGQDPDDYS